MRADFGPIVVSGCLCASLFAGPGVLAPQEGQVFVRIVDQAGTAAEGVDVSVSRCLPDPSNQWATPVYRNCRAVERVTNAAGEATFPSVRIGPRDRPYEYWIVASKSGYTVASDVVSLHPARNDFELMIHQIRSDPILVLFDDAQNAAGAGDFEGAEETMAEAVALMADEVDPLFGRSFPHDVYVTALSLLGHYRVQLGRLGAAEQALRQVIVVDRGDPFALRTLVILAAFRQDWTQAEEHARAYLDANPANADALLLLGNLHLETGRVQQAIEYLQQSADIDPEAPVAHRSLGAAYERSGRPQDAIRHYERYLELAGTPLDLGKIEAAIARLRNARSTRLTRQSTIPWPSHSLASPGRSAG